MLENLIAQYNQMQESYEGIKQGSEIVITYSIIDYLDIQAIKDDLLQKMLYIKSLIAYLDFYTYLNLK